MYTQALAQSVQKALRCSPILAMAAALLGACGGPQADLALQDGGTGLAAGQPAEQKAGRGFAAAANPGNSAYKIGTQDVIEISVFKVPDLSRVVQVADDGKVNLPLIGDVMAAGKTAQDVERELVKRYGQKYLKSPQVTVSVKEYNSQRVTVEGSVKKPGVYPVRGKASLLSFIATAEGLDENSDSMVTVFRVAGNQRTATRFDISAIRDGSAVDPAIQSGDIIVASSSLIKETFNTVLKASPLARPLPASK
jgi:polysaccharide export outer membrane protein